MPGDVLETVHARLMGALARHCKLRVFRIFRRVLGCGRLGEGGAALQYRLMREEELLAFCAEPALDLPAPKVRESYARGDLCVGALEGPNLVGYCWFAFSAAPLLDGVWIDFPAHLVYTYKSYVRPGFRGRGIAARLYCFPDTIVQERGRTAAFITVESHNRPSISAAKRSGFASAGTAGYLIRDEQILSWRSSLARRSAIRLRVPEFRV